jgi:hypothetical protein
LFFVLISTSNSLATQYHVDAGAKDVGDFSLERPFATVRQAAEIMKPGDVCLVREGTYREIVRPKHSGTAEAPLVFRAFPGERPVLSGCAPVTGWTQEEGDMYSAMVPMPLGHESQVFTGGKMLLEARWPNAGKPVPKGLLEFDTATMEKGTTPTKIVDDALPDVDLAGARVWVSSFKRWYCWTGAVRSSVKGAIEVEDNSDSKGNHICKPGGDYYVFGARSMMGGPSAEFGAGPCGLRQTVQGLEPGATYELMAMFRVPDGAAARLRVEGYGGPSLTSEPVTSGALRWKRATLRFTVGAGKTSAEIVLEKLSGGDALVYVDDPGLQLVE